MPRTFDNRFAQFPFSKRAARVGTGVIDRIKSALHVEDRNPNPIDFHGSSCAGWYLVREGYFAIGPPFAASAASDGHLLDFNATLWHRTISL
jgi:hypothetical protein